MFRFFITHLLLTACLFTEGFLSAAIFPEPNPTPVSVQEYIGFLKAVAATSDHHNLYQPSLHDQVVQIKKGDRFDYIAVSEQESEAIHHLTDDEMMRYCNWKDHGSPNGEAAMESTEDGTYEFSEENPSVTINKGGEYQLERYENDFVMIRQEQMFSPLMMLRAEEKEGETKKQENERSLSQHSEEEERSSSLALQEEPNSDLTENLPSPLTQEHLNNERPQPQRWGVQRYLLSGVISALAAYYARHYWFSDASSERAPEKALSEMPLIVTPITPLTPETSEECNTFLQLVDKRRMKVQPAPWIQFATDLEKICEELPLQTESNVKELLSELVHWDNPVRPEYTSLEGSTEFRGLAPFLKAEKIKKIQEVRTKLRYGLSECTFNCPPEVLETTKGFLSTQGHLIKAVNYRLDRERKVAEMSNFVSIMQRNAAYQSEHDARFVKDYETSIELLKKERKSLNAAVAVIQEHEKTILKKALRSADKNIEKIYHHFLYNRGVHLLQKGHELARKLDINMPIEPVLEQPPDVAWNSMNQDLQDHTARYDEAFQMITEAKRHFDDVMDVAHAFPDDFPLLQPEQVEKLRTEAAIIAASIKGANSTFIAYSHRKFAENYSFSNYWESTYDSFIRACNDWRSLNSTIMNEYFSSDKLSSPFKKELRNYATTPQEKALTAREEASIIKTALKRAYHERNNMGIEEAYTASYNTSDIDDPFCTEHVIDDSLETSLWKQVFQGKISFLRQNNTSLKNQ